MRVLRLVPVVVFAAALAAPQASALPLRDSEVKNYTRGTFSLLADLFVTFWNKAGCTIDPLGGCAPSPSDTKSGCRIDPLGRCADATAPATEAGCSIDPWGRCGS